MKVRALQPFAGPDGSVSPGDVVEVADSTGAYLLRHGFAREHAAASDARQHGASRSRRTLVAASRSDADSEQDEDHSASGKA